MRNSLIAMIYCVVSILLNFVSRKVFIDYLGVDILGLNTTAYNLLSFLNLAELGVGFAIAFSLYQPLADNNRDKINEIITLQGKLYKRIACIIIVGSAILFLFFPFMFRKMSLSLWYAYASFGVLLFSSLLTYFVNYRQIILTANQEEYKITLSYRLCILLKMLAQIILIRSLNNPYLWWLITEVVFAIISSCVLNLVINKSHSYLNNTKDTYKELKAKYPIIVVKVKQLFFHKIAAFAVTQTSPIIIYAFLNLSVVAYYGNYILIIGGVSTLLTSFFNGVSASVGNLIAENDKQKILRVFNELFCFRFLLSFTACICIYFLSSSFITVWIGAEYILPSLTVLLIIINMYFSLIRGVVDTFLNGYGLFSDIWAPIVEAILNLGGSVLGGWLYGLNGIITGAIVSQIVILFIWKPFFLFRYGMKVNLWQYIKTYLLCIVSGIFGCVVAWIVNSWLPFRPDQNMINFIIACFIFLFVSISAIGVCQLLLTQGMRDFLSRFTSLVRKS